MKVLDLFAGLEGWSAPFRERGHDVFSVDLDPRFDVDLHADVAALRPSDLPWAPDVVLASPPCEKFSVLTIGRNWERRLTPAMAGRYPHRVEQVARNPEAAAALELVRATVRLIAELAPAFWIVENPVGKLRKLASGLEAADLRTVTYCRFGEAFRKPTDLWGGFPPSLALAPPCRTVRGSTRVINGFEWALLPDGSPCHLAAPRGSRTGIQGKGVVDHPSEDPRLAHDRNRRGNLSAAKRQQRQLQGMPRPALLGEPEGSAVASRRKMHEGVMDGRQAFPDGVPPPDLKFRGGMLREMGAVSSRSPERANLAALRAKIPHALSLAVCVAAELDLAAGRSTEVPGLF